ncbi:helix-turn-helix transcriptional regulator [Rhizobium laguerreae]|uniref:ArsR/SmtB family transcription factor n=1 Tax=Rhizobium laguerreae TaxID=1076926 RepID=UPI001C9281C5|nr:metalloregulator ArsR/SmtB family transcription factor [Rhizobium laguerreae]MBY3246130.1 helix-turn-helix transcriptional regulator [Rhizobium laguerreae]MBY3252791.1 helix-turn-helix transcriptional regulator [Rhizobium laguerreae]
MDDRSALVAFAALSQATRLRVVRDLVVAGPDGLPAGVIAEKAEVSPSNISFHLKELEHAGLIEARRDARSIIYTARYDVLGDLVAFLVRDCCANDPSIRNALHRPGCGEGASAAS